MYSLSLRHSLSCSPSPTQYIMHLCEWNNLFNELFPVLLRSCIFMGIFDSSTRFLFLIPSPLLSSLSELVDQSAYLLFNLSSTGQILHKLLNYSKFSSLKVWIVFVDRHWDGAEKTSNDNKSLIRKQIRGIVLFATYKLLTKNDIRIYACRFSP